MKSCFCSASPRQKNKKNCVKQLIVNYWVFHSINAIPLLCKSKPLFGVSLLKTFASSFAESRWVVARVCLWQGLYAGQRLVQAARNRGELLRLKERPCTNQSKSQALFASATRVSLQVREASTRSKVERKERVNERDRATKRYTIREERDWNCIMNNILTVNLVDNNYTNTRAHQNQRWIKLLW